MNVDLDGNGRWSIDCRAETARGRTARARQQARGSRDFGKVFLDDVVTARCEYDAGDASLRVQVTDEGLSCPFGSHEEECVGVFEANASGSFELTAR
ncbi:hypothetical protein [Parvularcula oceani]|uniref:hypothetical protein n=1 Tax=Parvularcula oceani TaxID=1247963 RepID=UPI0004E14E73|nr:hypothetical protein [Parvularcula oceani]